MSNACEGGCGSCHACEVPRSSIRGLQFDMANIPGEMPESTFSFIQNNLDVLDAIPEGYHSRLLIGDTLFSGTKKGTEFVGHITNQFPTEAVFKNAQDFLVTDINISTEIQGIDEVSLSSGIVEVNQNPYLLEQNQPKVNSVDFGKTLETEQVKFEHIGAQESIIPFEPNTFIQDQTDKTNHIVRDNETSDHTAYPEQLPPLTQSEEYKESLSMSREPEITTRAISQESTGLPNLEMNQYPVETFQPPNKETRIGDSFNITITTEETPNEQPISEVNFTTPKDTITEQPFSEVNFTTPKNTIIEQPFSEVNPSQITVTAEILSLEINPPFVETDPQLTEESISEPSETAAVESVNDNHAKEVSEFSVIKEVIDISLILNVDQPKQHVQESIITTPFTETSVLHAAETSFPSDQSDRCETVTTNQIVSPVEFSESLTTTIENIEIFDKEVEDDSHINVPNFESMIQTHEQSKQQLFTFVSLLQESFFNEEGDTNVIETPIQTIRQFLIAAEAISTEFSGSISFDKGEESKHHETFVIGIEGILHMIQVSHSPQVTAITMDKNTKEYVIRKLKKFLISESFLPDEITPEENGNLQKFQPPTSGFMGLLFLAYLQIMTIDFFALHTFLEEQLEPKNFVFIDQLQ